MHDASVHFILKRAYTRERYRLGDVALGKQICRETETERDGRNSYLKKKGREREQKKEEERHPRGNRD